MQLGVALRDFPREPPKKYFGSNTIHITLDLDNVTEMTWNGLVDIEPGEFNLSRAETRVQLAYRNASARLDIVAEFVGIAKITAYVFDPLAPKI